MKKLLGVALLCIAAAASTQAEESPAWLAQSNVGGLSASSRGDFSADVFSVVGVAAGEDAIQLTARIESGNYIYRRSISANDSDGRPVQVALPAGTTHDDPYFGPSQVYEGESVTFSVPGSTKGPLSLHWQGCAVGGVCYAPKVLNVDLAASSTQGLNLRSETGAHQVGRVEGPAPEPAPVWAGSEDGSSTQNLAGDEAAAQRLQTLGPVVGPLLFFGFGILLAFTPCSLPMVPIVASMVTGGATTRRAAVLAGSYVAAMAMTYAGIGVLAGLAGANLQAALQTPWLLCAFAGLFVVLAASLFGLFELSLPSRLMNRLHSAGSGGRGGIVGAFALGLVSALMVGPCMTAPLAGALLYISQSGSALRGGTALFMLGLGMGVPLILIAVFGAKVLPRPGAWMERVRVVFGYLMMALAVEVLARFLPGDVGLGLWGAWGLAVAVGLHAWSRASTAERVKPFLGFGGALAGIWSVFLLIGAASGSRSLTNPLKPAMQYAEPAQQVSTMVAVKTIADVDRQLADAGVAGQWTLVDFYAEWCTSCHHNERSVFGDSEVQKALASVKVLRPDVTANDTGDQALMRRWGVQGPPTMLLIGPDGKERRAERSVGETSAAEFLTRLTSAKAS